mgnify:CR=1 FL=1
MENGDLEKIETILRRYAVDGIRVNDDVINDIKNTTNLKRNEIIQILFKLGVITVGTR